VFHYLVHDLNVGSPNDELPNTVQVAHVASSNHGRAALTVHLDIINEYYIGSMGILVDSLNNELLNRVQMDHVAIMIIQTSLSKNNIFL
jgi:hypothetical protein